jgi:hypothetical protein
LRRKLPLGCGCEIAYAGGDNRSFDGHGLH